MILRRCVVHRLIGLFARWGFVEHPYGHEYARERYTVTGRCLSDAVYASRTTAGTRSYIRTALVVAALVLASLAATGLLSSL